MIQISLPVEPDEGGVFDGRETAIQLIGMAYQLLVPYVEGCPACADALFSILANGVIEEAHEAGRRDGALSATVMALGEGSDRTTATLAHLEAARPGTVALIARETSHAGKAH